MSPGLFTGLMALLMVVAAVVGCLVAFWLAARVRRLLDGLLSRRRAQALYDLYKGEDSPEARGDPPPRPKRRWFFTRK
jgi:UPF0716 family protein affecting phage T7 exclusion